MFFFSFFFLLLSTKVIIGGRNKYLINGSNANNSRVHDLFCSVQLNVNNPHFLIMQVLWEMGDPCKCHLRMLISMFLSSLFGKVTIDETVYFQFYWLVFSVRDITFWYLLAFSHFANHIRNLISQTRQFLILVSLVANYISKSVLWENQ